MAITALSGFEPEWFEPEGQGDGEKTGFYLKPLTGPEYMEVLTHMRIVDGIQGLTADGMKAALDFSLVGWRNFKNASGAPVAFSRENRNFINVGTLVAIANKIIDISELSVSQKKT